MIIIELRTLVEDKFKLDIDVKKVFCSLSISVSGLRHSRDIGHPAWSYFHLNAILKSGNKGSTEYIVTVLRRVKSSTKMLFAKLRPSTSPALWRPAAARLQQQLLWRPAAARLQQQLRPLTNTSSVSSVLQKHIQLR